LLPDYNHNEKNNDYHKNNYDNQQSGLIMGATAFVFCEEKKVFRN